jgi:hypothetical protein
VAIQNRNLKVGTVLVGTYKKERYECRVEDHDGKPVFVLADGRRFKSTSAAASAVMGGKAVNGWLFWSQAEDVTADHPVSNAPSRRKVIRRLPNQQGIEAGKMRYWCNACMKSFIADAGDLPENCAAGHAAEQEAS